MKDILLKKQAEYKNNHSGIFKIVYSESLRCKYKLVVWYVKEMDTFSIFSPITELVSHILPQSFISALHKGALYYEPD